MTDLLNIINSTYGPVFTIIIFVLVAIFAITIIFLPLFVWGIHNQIRKATKELIKINKEIKQLSSHLQYRIQVEEQPPVSKPVNKNLMKNQVNPLAKGRLSGQIKYRKKVFIKPDDEMPGFRKESS